jgi:N-acetylglucosaminyl-diphospho-decaprenol L-rhamnosyltransferase
MTPAVGDTGAPITVAVVSWNTRDLLDDCLVSLRADADDGLIDVWVVDNASDDGSPDLVRESHPWVQLVASTENLGFGRAVNLVAERTDTPWLGIANADIRARPGSLSELLDAGRQDPGAGALAPRLILPDGSTQHSVFPFPSVPVTAAVALGLDRLWPGLGDELVTVGSWDEDRPRRVPWAVAAFLLVRREAWDAAGGFDEHQWMYAEDLDLGWSLHRAGFATRYVPTAAVEHESAASTTKAWGDERAVRWQRNTYAWMLRRRGWLFTRIVALIAVAGAATRFAALTPLALARPDPWRARRDRWAWWVRLHRSGLARASVLRDQR